MQYAVLKTLPSIKATINTDGKNSEINIDLKVYQGSCGVIPVFEEFADALAASGNNRKLVYEIF